MKPRYTYGRNFKHPRIYALVKYRYEVLPSYRTVKTLVFAATEDVVPRKDYR